jgi:hypothetical protein
MTALGCAGRTFRTPFKVEFCNSICTKPHKPGRIPEMLPKGHGIGAILDSFRSEVRWTARPVRVNFFSDLTLAVSALVRSYCGLGGSFRVNGNSKRDEGKDSFRIPNT